MDTYPEAPTQQDACTQADMFLKFHLLNSHLQHPNLKLTEALVMNT